MEEPIISFLISFFIFICGITFLILFEPMRIKIPYVNFNFSDEIKYKIISDTFGSDIKVNGGISNFKVSNEYLYDNSYVEINMGIGRSFNYLLKYNTIQKVEYNYQREYPIKIVIDKNHIIKSITPQNKLFAINIG